MPTPSPQAKTPLIACIGVIGKHDNPLHISIFPPYVSVPAPAPPPQTPPSSGPNPSSSTTTTTSTKNPRLTLAPEPPASTLLEFSFLLNASLDAFAARTRDRTRLDQDLGLLLRVDERRAVWGWETGTGVRFVVVTEGFWADGVVGGGGGAGAGGGAGGLKVVFRALQTAYIRLLQNPFYDPDEQAPLVTTPAVASSGSGSASNSSNLNGEGKRGGEIQSRRFRAEVWRLGREWKG